MPQRQFSLFTFLLCYNICPGDNVIAQSDLNINAPWHILFTLISQLRHKYTCGCRSMVIAGFLWSIWISRLELTIKSVPNQILAMSCHSANWTMDEILWWTAVNCYSCITGASHYGIGDLEALVAETHKFESRYMDTMVGPYVTEADKQRYKERSPIHYVDKMNCSLALFQGDEDKVMCGNPCY